MSKVAVANFSIGQFFKSASMFTPTSSIVTISAISSGSITFTPALSNYTQIRSASLSWLDSSSLSPFYSITGGGSFQSIDSTAFSFLFSFGSTTTIVTQSNSSFIFNSSSIVGASTRQFSISYLTQSLQSYYDDTVEEAYVQLTIDTTNNENSIKFDTGLLNSTTGEVEFTSNTPVKGGIGTSARGIGSFAMGSGSIAQESASIAEGINTLASGLASHAAGINTTASGQAAFSMGIETDADGMASFAAGSGSWARGTATVAFGIGTVASSSGQLAVGHYNEAKTDINNIFVVGDGTSNSLRRNVIEVYGGQGALFRGVKIDTVSPSGPATTTIDGFNVYGRTIFYGGVTQSANIITIDGDYGGITHDSASYIAETYTSLGQLRGRTLFNYKGIDFNNSVQTTAPSSTHLWTNSSNRLFYSSSAVILNDGNTLGGTMTIGTNDANNLQLETNNTTRIFISSSGNVGIGKSNPTARLDISGSVITTGSLSITGSLSLKGPLYDNLGTAGTPDQILFTTSTGVEWRDNIADAAQDLVITGKNVGLTTIEKGTPLYFTGSGTAGNIVGILPADAGNPDRMPAGGVAGEQITAGSEGDVYIYGYINGVNTSAFSSGDDVFVAVGGGYTNIKPTGSAFIQKLGNIEKVDPTNGSGVIQGPSWYNDLPNWEIGRVMVGRSTGQPVTSSLVYLDEANGRLGLGTTTPTARLHISGANNDSLLRIQSPASASILFVSGSGNVGIGTATPASRLQVSLPSNTSNQSIFRSDAGDNLLAINTFPTTNRMQLLLGDYNGTSAPNLAAISDSNTGIQWAGSDIIKFVNGGSENVTINASGNVGIGTTSPQRRLHVDASGSSNTDIPLLLTSVDANNRVGIRVASSSVSAGRQHTLYHRTNSPLVEWVLSSNSGEFATWHFLPQDDSNTGLSFLVPRTTPGAIRIVAGVNQSMLSLGASGSNQHLNISSSGNVGIGTTTPTTTLNVNGTTLLQGGQTTVRGSGATSATTALRVENSNASASLVVLDNGNVGIGTTTPSASLQVQGNFQISTGSLYTYGQNTDIDSGSIRTVMSVSTGSYRAAFFDYVLNKSTNARAGTVFSVWNGASVEWNDVSTNDIGNTAEINLSVGLSGSNVILYASSSTNDWSVKALSRML